MSDATAIRAEGLVKRYGEKVALGGVGFEVPRGTVCSLLGPNGAGKSTAVRILTTLARPDAGTATVAGLDVVTQADRVRARIGLAAQDATVDRLLTGRENLVMVGELHHVGRAAARARADELLERFDLTDAGNRVVKTYSGGMRRRLDLAATMVSAPEVLFLDEPTTGLDPRARNELWDVLDTLVRDGVTILLTTQYLEEAERLADDIVVIDHGRVIAHGTATDLKAQVGGAQLFATAASPDELDRLAGVMETVVGHRPDVDVAMRIVTAPTDGGPRMVSNLVDALADAGVEVADLGLRQPTLDDVFLTLTGSHVAPEQEEVRA
ncbi:MAG: ATP-binding cassette domain-containing protein [Thermoleophilia bacterium]